VAVAAIVQSDTALSEELGLSGRRMAIKVDGGSVQDINFPVTINAETIDHKLTVNTINKQLTNAVAFILGDKLNIVSTSTGSNASLELMAAGSDGVAIPAEESAYALLEVDHLVGQTISGQGQYTNMSYTVPYSSFPSPMASVDEVVINDADTKMYRYFGGTLREFSEDSAININAYAKTASRYGLTHVAGSHQPAFQDEKQWLFGRPASGSKTNELVSLGKDATLEIPLCHDLSVPADGAANWPDPSGKNKLVIKAVGMSLYSETGATSDLGTAASLGAAGNLLQVNINYAAQPDGANDDSATVSYVAGTGVTFTVSHNTTFATLDAAIKGSADLAANAKEISVSLQMGGLINAASASHCLDFSGQGGAAAWPTPLWGGNAGLATTLSGGADPIDFSADASATQQVGPQGATVAEDQQQAWVCGAVNIGGGDTAADLGITAETLKVSIDGGAPVSITFAGTDVVHSTINAALGTQGGCAITGYDVTNALGETFTPLRIHSASSNGHDSTVEISANNPLVIQRLFSGSTSETSAPVSSGVALTQGRGISLNSADYNPIGSLNHTSFQKSVVPGTLKAVFSDVIALPHIALEGEPDALLVEAGNTVNLGIKIDGAGAIAVPIVVPNTGFITQEGGTTAQEKLVDALNTGLAAAPGGDLSGVLMASTLDGSVLISHHNANDNSTLEFEDAAGASDAATVTLMGASCFGVVSTAARVSVTVSDSGTDFALVCESVSNGFGNAVNPHSADIQNWCFGSGSTNVGNAGIASSTMDYSSGDLVIAWSGDSETALAAQALPATLRNDGSTLVQVTYNRSWANAVQAAPQGYSGRVHHGTSIATELSDMAWNNGQVLARVVEINPANGFAGSSLTLSEFAVDNKAKLSKWYVVAEGLPSSGRTLQPEATGNDLEQTYSIKHALNRDAGGVAVSGGADVYVDYKALRLDVSAKASSPGLLVFSSIAEVEANIGPIDTRNPLAFGLYLAFLNTTNINIAGMGVDEVTADAPDGTVKAYANTLDYLKLKEVYALAPLTHDMEVFKVFNQHVTDMSAPTAKKERMAIVCPNLPTEKPATLAFSSSDFEIAAAGGGKFTVTDATGGNIMLALNESTVKDSKGNPLDISVGGSFAPEQDVYLDREGDPYRYLITGLPDHPTGSAITIEPTNDVWRPGLFGPGTGGNDDAYYHTSNPVDWAASGEAATIFVRQPSTDLSTTGGKLATCETLAEWAGGVTGFQNRRLVMLQPDQVGVSIGGLETLVPGYYLTGAIAAMIGQQNPSQPFTNLPMVGFTRPVGSSDLFSENQMSTAAAGGIYWVIQDIPGGALVSRHQLTTDLTSIKTRELSILKSVDYVAKLLRSQVKRFIGRNNITKQLLEAVSLGISGALASVTGSVVAGASLDAITQDKDAPDTIQCEVSITPFYPANYIKITIFV
tara:strand:+ start:2249 stop:6514 length:4266 start_codon:yes stop_codon:yes gene_type:complete